MLIGVAGGLVIGLAAGTRRTDSAPERRTSRAGGDPDLVVQQMSGRPLTVEVAKIPGVAHTRSIAFVPAFLVSPNDGSLFLDPDPYAGDDTMLGARVVEGRFTDPDAPDEFVVNRRLAAMLAQRFGTRVGDRFDVAAFDQNQIEFNRAFDSGEPPTVPRFEVTLVGITETPSDFDNPSPTMVFSQSFLTAHAAVGVVQTLMVVDLEPGADGGTVMDSMRQLPDGDDAYSVVYRIVSADARRAVRFQVTALWIVTAIAIVAAAVVVLQFVARMLRMGNDERSSLMAIGWRPQHLMIERALEGGITALLAAPVAVVVGYAVTALFPIGALRAFEPDTGPRMDSDRHALRPGRHRADRRGRFGVHRPARARHRQPRKSGARRPADRVHRHRHGAGHRSTLQCNGYSGRQALADHGGGGRHWSGGPGCVVARVAVADEDRRPTRSMGSELRPTRRQSLRAGRERHHRVHRRPP